MFNGIIEEVGRVVSVRSLGGGKELTISARLAPELEVDNSLCVDGVCQTVVKQERDSVTVQVVEETLRKTTLGRLKTGDMVNLERSLSLAQRIDGHIVQGHVDTTGTIDSISKEGTNWLCRVAYDPEWRDLVVGRGSIALEGISLTVAQESNGLFTVAIIPYTWDHTVLRYRKKGDLVNLEFDVLGKYVVRFMQNRQQGSHASPAAGADSGGNPSQSGFFGSDTSSDGQAQTGSGKGKGMSEEQLRRAGFLS
jgi:riboflavin synthase